MAALARRALVWCRPGVRVSSLSRQPLAHVLHADTDPADGTCAALMDTVVSIFKLAAYLKSLHSKARNVNAHTELGVQAWGDKHMGMRLYTCSSMAMQMRILSRYIPGTCTCALHAC